MSRRTVTALTLSAAALVSIATWEGYRSTSYDDGVGVQTIGFGTTTQTDGTPVKPQDKTDPVRALIRLGEDADKHARAFAACVHVPLYQREYDAYVSWAYNVGTRAACQSTLVQKLNAGDYAGACHELLRWTRAGGRVLPGLVKRRQSEYERCMGHDDES